MKELEEAIAGLSASDYDKGNIEYLAKYYATEKAKQAVLDVKSIVVPNLCDGDSPYAEDAFEKVLGSL